MFTFAREIFLFATLVLSISTTASAAPQTVPFVDLSRYAGNWYQIANVPMFFEGGVCACAKQKLTPAEAGVIKVYNSCNSGTPQGRLRDISGEAYNDDPATNAKFTVDFNLPFKGTYWIVGLDAEYRYAVVTDKNGSSLYILSKTPTLATELYEEAVAIAAAQSLKVEQLRVTEHQGCQYPE